MVQGLDVEELNTAAEAFIAGDLDPILRRYADCIAVFLPTGIYRISGHEQLRGALAEHREGALRAGTIGLTAEIAAVGLPSGPKTRTFVDWTYHMPLGTPNRCASAVYYTAERPQVGSLIEMIEYRRLAFPEAANWHENRVIIPSSERRTGTGES